MGNTEGNTTQIKLLGLLKLVRLLRLGRIIRYLNFKQGAVLGVKLIQLLCFLVLLVHWIGCIWYILIRDEGAWVPPKDLDRDPRDPLNFWTKSEFYEWDIMQKYILCFYYAVLTMMGNELAPRNTLQTVVASLIIITGAVSSAYIFGEMAAMIDAVNQ